MVYTASTVVGTYISVPSVNSNVLTVSAVVGAPGAPNGSLAELVPPIIGPQPTPTLAMDKNAPTPIKVMAILTR